MQSVAFITSISRDRIKLIFSTLISHTYLESNFYCMQHDNLLEGSYSIYMVESHGKTRFKDILEAQVVSLLGARNLASMRGKGKLNMFE